MSSAPICRALKEQRHGQKIENFLSSVWCKFSSFRVSLPLASLPLLSCVCDCLSLCVLLHAPLHQDDYEISFCVLEVCSSSPADNNMKPSAALRLTSSWVRKDSFCSGVKYLPIKQFRSWKREKTHNNITEQPMNNKQNIHIFDQFHGCLMTLTFKTGSSLF